MEHLGILLNVQNKREQIQDEDRLRRQKKAALKTQDEASTKTQREIARI